MSTNFRSFAKIDGANDVVILVLVHNLWPIWLHFLMGLLLRFWSGAKRERGCCQSSRVTDVACKSEAGKKNRRRCFDFPKLSQIKIGRHGHFFARAAKSDFSCNICFSPAFEEMQFWCHFGNKDIRRIFPRNNSIFIIRNYWMKWQNHQIDKSANCQK